MSVRLFDVSVAVVSVAVLVFAAGPLIAYVGETTPWLRKPWAWQQVPDVTSCDATPVAAQLEVAADQACALLLAHQARLHAPSLSAAIAIDGEIVWRAAVGWADLAENRAATPQTLYRIGSTSKPVTGTLLARMVDSRRVDLDDPIATYDSALPNPAWAQLTLRQLASHMAGLPEYGTNRDMRGLYQSLALRRHYPNVRDGLALFDGSPLRYPPGSGFEYSSFGTQLLASVLQSAGQQAFDDLIQQQVLAPLGLSTPVADQQVSERARFYQLNGRRAQLWRDVDLSSKVPGGGFMSTPADLVLLGSAWLNPDFISEDTRKAFWAPQELNSGEINPQSYALTWRWNSTDGYAHHGGVSKGSMAWLAVYPEQLLAVALTMNTTISRFADFSSLQSDLVSVFSAARGVQQEN
jgi:serine beta-lactamase-like protein LACTB